MATGYDHWKAGDFDRDVDDAIAERAEALTAERLTDDKRVQDAIADALGNDYDDVFPACLRRFYIAFDAAQTDIEMADIGLQLFRSLQPSVEGAIREDAYADAVIEHGQNEADGEESQASLKEAA